MGRDPFGISKEGEVHTISYRMCQHLTSGELQNQFELFISSGKTGSKTSFQSRIMQLPGYLLADNDFS